ncbi:hypothetical protein NDU88_006902 [Pleurodeles waltl]|uniref:Uncharacterized protein n=1 Tax=Pleurodeles waltl TaxID=8319 RepID=A0AAV7SRA5_PLEWA|nr:hypothetical protein NDU88_006902 [Pleurodeles waltl]
MGLPKCRQTLQDMHVYAAAANRHDKERAASAEPPTKADMFEEHATEPVGPNERVVFGTEWASVAAEVQKRLARQQPSLQAPILEPGECQDSGSGALMVSMGVDVRGRQQGVAEWLLKEKYVTDVGVGSVVDLMAKDVAICVLVRSFIKWGES